MIAMTTSNSMSVNARERIGRGMGHHEVSGGGRSNDGILGKMRRL